MRLNEAGSLLTAMTDPALGALHRRTMPQRGDAAHCSVCSVDAPRLLQPFSSLRTILLDGPQQEQNALPVADGCCQVGCFWGGMCCRDGGEGDQIGAAWYCLSHALRTPIG
jgi:hypothetical protein